MAEMRRARERFRRYVRVRRLQRSRYPLRARSGVSYVAAGLVLDTGLVVGADAAGAIYDGTYNFNAATGLLDVDVTMSAPAGVWPVQTGVPLTAPLKVPIKVALPRDLGEASSEIQQ